MTRKKANKQSWRQKIILQHVRLLERYDYNVIMIIVQQRIGWVIKKEQKMKLSAVRTEMGAVMSLVLFLLVVQSLLEGLWQKLLYLSSSLLAYFPIIRTNHLISPING